MGAAFVRKACEAGALVLFTYHQNQKRAQELEERGAQAIQLDLLNTPSLENFKKDLRSKLKVLHVLVHNAALTQDAAIQNMSEGEWDEVLAANLKAPYLLTKKLLPFLFRADPGKIFFITSRAVSRGIFGAANYAASKAGLVGLAKSLAAELGRKNVLVNCVNPGFMKSAMTEPLPSEVFGRNVRESALGRVSNPDEVAEFLVYLSSDKMTQVTGQIFHFESRNNY